MRKNEKNRIVFGFLPGVWFTTGRLCAEIRRGRDWSGHKIETDQKGGKSGSIRQDRCLRGSLL